jgi:hypothetical protein
MGMGELHHFRRASTRMEIRHDLSCGICAISGNGSGPSSARCQRRIVHRNGAAPLDVRFGSKADKPSRAKIHLLCGAWALHPQHGMLKDNRHIGPFLLCESIAHGSLPDELRNRSQMLTSSDVRNGSLATDPFSANSGKVRDAPIPTIQSARVRMCSDVPRSDEHFGFALDLSRFGPSIPRSRIMPRGVPALVCSGSWCGPCELAIRGCLTVRTNA